MHFPIMDKNFRDFALRRMPAMWNMSNIGKAALQIESGSGITF